MTIARIVWWSMVCLVSTSMLWALFLDLLLIGNGDESISGYLRRYPYAYIVPLLVLIVVASLLTLHLLFNDGSHNATPPQHPSIHHPE